MRYALAISMAVALAVSASVADAASKKHPRYTRHVRGAAMQYPPGWSSPPGPVNPGYRCLQDEGYGRYTICGQGR